MKRFLQTLAICVILSLVLCFFLAGALAQSGVYLRAAFAGVAAALLIHGFLRLSERIDRLEKRLRELEDAQSGASPKNDA